MWAVNYFLGRVIVSFAGFYIFIANIIMIMRKDFNLRENE